LTRFSSREPVSTSLENVIALCDRAANEQRANDRPGRRANSRARLVLRIDNGKLRRCQIEGQAEMLRSARALPVLTYFGTRNFLGEVLSDRGPLLGLILTHIKNSVAWRVNQQHGAAPFDIHGDEEMVAQTNIHFFTNWAKERLDEMDAAAPTAHPAIVAVPKRPAPSHELNRVVAIRRSARPVPLHFTKTELRAMLAEAAANTARALNSSSPSSGRPGRIIQPNLCKDVAGRSSGRSCHRSRAA